MGKRGIYFKQQGNEGQILRGKIGKRQSLAKEAYEKIDRPILFQGNKGTGTPLEDFVTASYFIYVWFRYKIASILFLR